MPGTLLWRKSEILFGEGSQEGSRYGSAIRRSVSLMIRLGRAMATEIRRWDSDGEGKKPNMVRL